MRRPLKPFVTEYKGSSRRSREAGSDQTFGGDAQVTRVDAGKRPAAGFDFKTFEAMSQDTKSRAPQPSRADTRFSPLGGEDGYEAALRAADALFAPPNDSAGPPRPERAEAEGSDPVSFRSQADGEPFANKAPPSGNGRILRSLDEPPALGFADREEILPRRRGRKPGSKNKPRNLVHHEAGASSGSATKVGEDARAFRPAVSALHLVAAPRVDPGVAPVPSGARSAIRGLPALPMRRAPQPSRDRFAWVRTKLAPGERWKRRLPKVIW